MPATGFQAVNMKIYAILAAVLTLAASLRSVEAGVLPEQTKERRVDTFDGGSNSTLVDLAHDGGAIIWILENSNCFISVQIHDRYGSLPGGQGAGDESSRIGQPQSSLRGEQCPEIRGGGNHNFPLRIEINGQACRVMEARRDVSFDVSGRINLANYLCPDIGISYSSSNEIYISAWGSHLGPAPFAMPPGANISSRPYAASGGRSLGNLGAKERTNYYCPGIDVAFSTGIDISIVIDNSRDHEPFRGFNIVHEQRGFRASLTVNNLDCPVPRINIVHCEHTTIRIHTVLSGD